MGTAWCIDTIRPAPVLMADPPQLGTRGRPPALHAGARRRSGHPVPEAWERRAGRTGWAWSPPGRSPGCSRGCSVSDLNGLFEVACPDALGRVPGLPAHALLGGQVRDSVECSAYLFRPLGRPPRGRGARRLGRRPRRGGHGGSGAPLRARARLRLLQGQGRGLRAGPGGAVVLALAGAFPGRPLRLDPDGVWSVDGPGTWRTGSRGSWGAWRTRRAAPGGWSRSRRRRHSAGDARPRRGGGHAQGGTGPADCGGPRATPGDPGRPRPCRGGDRCGARAVAAYGRRTCRRHA